MIERGDRYSRGAIAFHWVIAALVLFNLFVGLFHESLLEGVRVMPAHKALGMAILALTLIRILWRLVNKAPPPPETMRAWERRASRFAHHSRTQRGCAQKAGARRRGRRGRPIPALPSR